MSHSRTMMVWYTTPLMAPMAVTAPRMRTHRSVALASPAMMPVSMARPTIHGPSVCGTIHTMATSRPVQKSAPC